MKKKIILVCKTQNKKCEEKGYGTRVKNKTILFCCKEGFKKSLIDFSKTIKPLKP